MRSLLGVCLLAALAAGCVPDIPVKPQFGTSALRPTRNIPPEFAAFNNYQAEINPLMADQICAVPYIREVEKTVAAAPGEIVAATGRCADYYPLFGAPAP